MNWWMHRTQMITTIFFTQRDSPANGTPGGRRRRAMAAQTARRPAHRAAGRAIIHHKPRPSWSPPQFTRVGGRCPCLWEYSRPSTRSCFPCFRSRGVFQVACSQPSTPRKSRLPADPRHVSERHSLMVLSFSSAAEAMMFSVGWQAVQRTTSETEFSPVTLRLATRAEHGRRRENGGMTPGWTQVTRVSALTSTWFTYRCAPAVSGRPPWSADSRGTPCCPRSPTRSTDNARVKARESLIRDHHKD